MIQEPCNENYIVWWSVNTSNLNSADEWQLLAEAVLFEYGGKPEVFNKSDCRALLYKTPTQTFKRLLKETKLEIGYIARDIIFLIGPIVKDV